MLGIVSLVSLPSTVRISGGDDSAEILFASRDTVLSLELTPIARMAMEAFFSDQRLV